MVKRSFDVAVALVGLVVLSPVLVAIALAAWVTQGRPVLWSQLRVGQWDKSFRMWKFRTMTDHRDASDELLPDAERITRLGRWLRRTSLDELPSLWNVVKGDMSFVGPRPLPVRYLGRYTSAERRRHLVRPGVSGWAQVQGRNTVAWDERLALDVWYVDNATLALDLRILLRTMRLVLSGRGVAAADSATMDELRPPPIA